MEVLPTYDGQVDKTRFEDLIAAGFLLGCESLNRTVQTNFYTEALGRLVTSCTTRAGTFSRCKVEFAEIQHVDGSQNPGTCENASEDFVWPVASHHRRLAVKTL